MNPLQAYQIYLALKLHFTSEKYDFFKYGGSVKVNADKFSERRDKYFFEKVSRNLSKENLIEFFVANFVKNPKIWVGNMNDENYAAWKKNVDGLLYTFEQDCKRVANMAELHGVRSYVNSGPWGNPYFLQALSGGDISTESFLVIDAMIGLVEDFDKKFPDDVVWSSKSFHLKKYRPFVVQLLGDDAPKYKRIVLEVLLNDD